MPVSISSFMELIYKQDKYHKNSILLLREKFVKCVAGIGENVIKCISMLGANGCSLM